MLSQVAMITKYFHENRRKIDENLEKFIGPFKENLFNSLRHC